MANGATLAHGSSGAELFYDTWNEAFPDNSIGNSVVFDAGDQGAEEARFTGTHSGTLHTPNGDIPPTGKRMVSQYAAVVPVHDGKVTAFHMYFDVAEVLVQLGLMS
ncbi:MAG TPA: ester cyclase [Acidimicrobiales bacterium]|nr:ester cyclase [Acidimicrobiales bacterium]